MIQAGLVLTAKAKSSKENSELSPEYKLFWFYIKDNCDHAGMWKPKIRAFKSATGIEIDLDKALEGFRIFQCWQAKSKIVK